jgi:hypothetical protein
MAAAELTFEQKLDLLRGEFLPTREHSWSLSSYSSECDQVAPYAEDQCQPDEFEYEIGYDPTHNIHRPEPQIDDLVLVRCSCSDMPDYEGPGYPNCPICRGTGYSNFRSFGTMCNLRQAERVERVRAKREEEERVKREEEELLDDFLNDRVRHNDQIYVPLPQKVRGKKRR